LRAWAEKHIKPPELTRILVTPEYAQMKPGTKQTFSAKGLDQFDRDFECKEDSEKGKRTTSARP